MMRILFKQSMTKNIRIGTKGDSPEDNKRGSRRVKLGAILSASVLFSVFFFGSAPQARAYTDPGSGALIWQMLVAGFVGLMFYFRKFTSWFRERRNGSKTGGSEASPQPDTEFTSSDK